MPKKQTPNVNPDEDNIINQAEDIDKSAEEPKADTANNVETDVDPNESAVSQTDPEMDEYLADKETAADTVIPVSSETNVFEPPGVSDELPEETSKEAQPPDTSNESQFDDIPEKPTPKRRRTRANTQVIKLPDVPEARRFFNYPLVSIKESLSNAVYHKGYDEREPIEVRVLPDRIQIVSHPGADRSVSIEGLKQYKVYNRRYRNRRIGDFLKELHLTEGRNTGFKKILDALKHNGSPLPIFETDEDRLSFAVTIYRHPEFTDDGTVNGTVNQLSENESKVLACMREDSSISKNRISEKTGISVRTISRIIAELKRRQIIERKGSDKNGEWIVF